MVDDLKLNRNSLATELAAPERRGFTAAYKLAVVEEAQRATRPTHSTGLIPVDGENGRTLVVRFPKRVQPVIPAVLQSAGMAVACSIAAGHGALKTEAERRGRRENRWEHHPPRAGSLRVKRVAIGARGVPIKARRPEWHD